MVKSETTSITPTQHAANHAVGGTDPLINPLLLHATRHAPGGADEIVFGAIVDQMGSRALATNYQNTTGHFMMISVLFTKTNGVNTTVNGYAKATSPADVVVATYSRIEVSDSTLTFIVPPDYYYRVTSGNVGTSPTHWYEWTM